MGSYAIAELFLYHIASNINFHNRKEEIILITKPLFMILKKHVDDLLLFKPKCNTLFGFKIRIE